MWKSQKAMQEDPSHAWDGIALGFRAPLVPLRPPLLVHFSVSGVVPPFKTFCMNVCGLFAKINECVFNWTYCSPETGHSTAHVVPLFLLPNGRFDLQLHFPKCL